MEEKVLLHVGCGGAGREAVAVDLFQKEEWCHVRLDIDVNVQPDVVDDIRYLQNVADESVDGIYSSHNLEHLHPYDLPLALQAFRRVLKKGGVIVCLVPDFQLACERVAEGNTEPVYVSPAGPIYAMDMIFGYRRYTKDNPFQMHRNGFTPQYMNNILATHEFRDIVVSRRPELYDIVAQATK